MKQHCDILQPYPKDIPWRCELPVEHVLVADDKETVIRLCALHYKWIMDVRDRVLRDRAETL